jgi:hypothetical protein
MPHDIRRAVNEHDLDAVDEMVSGGPSLEFHQISGSATNDVCL